ncbi:RNA-directed DNA polymerase, eukaryota, reverse transcriptase zinc-binding domain protein, partial [Tanacetum coccineum]
VELFGCCFLRCYKVVKNRFIKAIHSVRGAFDNHNSTNRNSIWLDIIRALSSLNRKGINLLAYVQKKVGDGENSLFWDDIWLREVPLKKQYPRLYALDLCKDVSVADKMRHSILDFSFHWWVNLVHIKVNILAWRIRLDILPSRLNLSSRDLEIPSILCPVCNEAAKSSSHIFFSYSLARQIQSKVLR